MSSYKVFGAALLVMGIASAAMAQTAPLHNFSLPTDVDNNTLIQPLDALILINSMQPSASPQVAPLTSSTTYYLDTSNDQLVSPLDLLLVINQLSAAPEPSTLVTAGIGLLTLIGAIRRRRMAIKT